MEKIKDKESNIFPMYPAWPPAELPKREYIGLPYKDNGKNILTNKVNKIKCKIIKIRDKEGSGHLPG